MNGVVKDFKFNILEGDSQCLPELTQRPELPVIQDVILERGTVEGGQDFFDWALGARTEEVFDQAVVGEEHLTTVRIFNHRKWLWPVIHDLFDVRTTGIELGVNDGYGTCEMEFGRKVTWPWYKAAWWWVKQGFKNLFCSEDEEDAGDE